MFNRLRQNVGSSLRFKTSYRSAKLLVVSMVCCTLLTIHTQSNSTFSQSKILVVHIQDIQSLAAGQTVEREIAGGEIQSYRIDAGAGEYVSLIIEPRGIEIKFKLSSPDGKQVAQTENIAEGVTGRRLSFITAMAGANQLIVSAAGETPSRGGYKIRLAERRAATSQDVSSVAAERAVEEAERLDNLRKVETTRQAIAKFEAALALWRTAGDHRGEANTLESLAAIWRRLGEYQKSLEALGPALQFRQEMGDNNGEASVLHDLGETYTEMAEYQKALDYFDRALSLKTGIRALEAELLNNSGAVNRRLGNFRVAQDYYRRSLALSRATGGRREQANTLNNLGVASFFLGEYQQALDAFGQALPIWRALGDTDGEGLTANNLGGIYSTLGDSKQALEAYTQALQLWRAAGNRPFEAFALNNLGGVHRNSGERDKALEYLNQALAIFRAINDRRGEGISLESIGSIYGVGGDHQQAMDYFTKAIQLYRIVGDRLHEATTLRHIADTWHSMGEYEKARDCNKQALQLRRETGHRNGEAQALLALARAEQKLGKLVEALPHIEPSIEIIELLRTRIVSTDLRAVYQARNQDFYEFYIELLMELHTQRPSEGYAEKALQVSERARSRSLLDLLTETQADLRQGADAGLLDRERLLMAQINDKETRRRQLLSGKRDEARIAAIEKELNELLTQYQEVQAKIRSDSPRYAALTQPQPLSLKEIQERVVDDETLLLEYKLGADRSYLWAVTPHAFRSFDLPARADIEKAASRVNELLFSLRNQTVEGETPRQSSDRLRRAIADYTLATAQLSQMLLGPAEDLLGKKRLLIVGDGVLQYIPFAALPIPETPGRDTATRRESSDLRVATSPRPRVGPVPLIVDHEIVNLPSASVLAVLRQEQKGRTQADASVAVLADPVFSADDVRFSAGGARSRTKGDQKETALTRYGSLERSARDAGIDSFHRLRFSRDEAMAITDLLPPDRALSALDFKASRATALSADLGRYRIVHFATHGLLNTEHPELSGLVLSLVDQRGLPQDGFLRLHEVYGLKLSADLVVLSGCETALGKEMRGEGLIGLTRGFMYAGAARVVASLWRVDDRGTAELMKRFYQGMLKEHLRPAAALRAAQVSMLKEKRWSAPQYWAAFTLQGEWR